MTCMYCKGEMQRKAAPFHVDRHGYHLHWDAVPAWVCTQCGEPYFEEQEVTAIQESLADLDKHSQLSGGPNRQAG